MSIVTNSNGTCLIKYLADSNLQEMTPCALLGNYLRKHDVKILSIMLC